MSALQTGKEPIHNTVGWLALVVGCIAIALPVSLLVVGADRFISPLAALVAAAAGGFLLLCLVKPEVSLVLVFLLLPFHLAIKQYAPDPLGTYWKEGLLLLSFFTSLVNGIARKRLTIPRSRIWLPLLVFCGIILARFLFSDDHYIGAWGLYVYYMYLPLLFVMFWRAGSADQLVPYFWLLMLTTIASAAGGIAEFVFGFVTGLQQRPIWWIFGTSIRRVTFTFDAPMTLGTFLAVGLCLFVTFWLTYPATKKQRLFFMGGALLSLLGLVLTFSRGPTVQAVGSLGYIALVYFLSIRNKREQFALVGKVLLFCIGAIALTLPVLVVSMGDVLFPYMRSFFEWNKALNPGVAIGNAVRIRMWIKSLDAFWSQPFAGIGLGMTGYTTLRFLSDSWITESLVLKILVEAGLFALLAFVWLYARLVVTGTEMALTRGRSVQRALAFAASAGLVGIFIEGLVLQILETKQVSLEFWFFIAALMLLDSRWKTPLAQHALPARSEAGQGTAHAQ